MHTKEGVADQFIEDVTTEVEKIMKNPGQPVEGKVEYFCIQATWIILPQGTPV